MQCCKVLPWHGRGGNPPEETMGSVTFYHWQENYRLKSQLWVSSVRWCGLRVQLWRGEQREQSWGGAPQSPGPGNAPLFSKERVDFRYFF